MYFLASGVGNMATTVFLSSLEDTINLNITSDKLQISDIDMFIDIFNKKIKELGLEGGSPDNISG